MLYKEFILKYIVPFFNQKKAKDIWICEFLHSNYAFYDFTILVTAQSYLHQKNLAQGITAILKKEKHFLKLPFNCSPDNNWVLLDYNNFSIHIMTQEARQYYKLEEFWIQNAEISMLYQESNHSSLSNPPIYESNPSED